METLLASLFYLLWRGIAIGIMISAPMGPVGMLCIQRTLSKGRMTGLYTGIGAAISDIFYCLLTGFGLSFIEDFLTRNQNIIQLVGSLVLIGFAIWLARKNPAASLHRPVDGDTASPRKDILGGFLFTFSNPLILFLIIGLFARFSFLGAGLKWYYYIVGYIAIAGGALGWWWIVTFSVDKVRSHFNLRSMWLVNRIISAVILIFGVVGIITSITAMAGATEIIPGQVHRSETICANSARGYEAVDLTPDTSPRPAPGNPLTLVTEADGGAAQASIDCGTPVASLSLLWRLRVLNPSMRGDRRWWSLTLVPADCGTPAPVIEFGSCEIFAAGDLETRRVVRLTWMPDGTPGSARTFDLDDLSQWDSEMAYRLSYSGRGATLTVTTRSGGEPVTLECGERGLPEISEIIFHPLDGRRIELDWITLQLPPPYVRGVYPEPAERAPRDTVSDADTPEGIWYVSGRDMEESLLRLGGDYRLRLMPDGENGWIMTYLAGATVHRDRWQPGMVKGYLTPALAENVYDLTWIDAEGGVMSHELTATLDVDNMVLTLSFPYQNSTLTLSRVTQAPR